jgi:putative phosphoribosyl transferase
MLPAPLFEDRAAAGGALAQRLGAYAGDSTVVVGLARGGVVVAAEVARALGAPLDALAVRKVGHPFEPEYALGAVAPFTRPYLRASDGLSQRELEEAVERARRRAEALDRVLHPAADALPVAWCRVLLVDDGVATGSTMIAAVLWARARRADSVVVAAPVVSRHAARVLRAQASTVVALHELDEMRAVGLLYERFPQVENAEVLRLLRTHAASAAEAGT